MEKRREGNDVRKEIRETKEGGGMMEIDDDTLMGGNSGTYQAMQVYDFSTLPQQFHPQSKTDTVR